MNKQEEMDKKLREGERYLHMLDQAEGIFEDFDALSEKADHVLDDIECFVESLTDEDIQCLLEDMDENTWEELAALIAFLDGGEQSLQDDWRDLGKAIGKYRREEQRGNKAAQHELKRTIKELSRNVREEGYV